MTFRTTSLLLFLAIMVYGAGAAAANLEDGFMGFTWGDDIWNYQGLEELYHKGDITFYADPGTSYVIEGMTIGDVIYGFYRGKFYAVYINIDTVEKYDVVLHHMKSNYGLPDNKTSDRSSQFSYKWKYHDVAIKLKSDGDHTAMKVAFYHEPTAVDLKKERIIKEIEATDRFFPIDKNREINMVPFLESWSER